MSSEELPFHQIQMRHVDALKFFCWERNLKVSGTKAEPVACVFPAWEFGILVQPKAEDRISRIHNEKSKLLLTPCSKLPDLSTLKNG